ncbi:UDP-N-acetylmuramoyl-L-alanyl-D-glutamate--2,6-diaminopimelate ligase [Desulfolutivibrio sulfoxidireducens]|uniref:UDP-N-acetylmuramoyl-L-alanyl-D-glutamate--2, 6-diaminopimelate ligase n=1 Tax=Desulfolutivibrio sulfoxidireducens TaxID=2773299 RepID=UPI00159E762C|nr:UDP-N-acetylmuramoyl-L-alanyl-D-glutamate--2,6-diaminopimelate ligase [Desulfolutivibrio sulfoxidireducens]QLA21686.1 UDP-N-acetylmuramoyl-L-alanyl-D-glutamate--2,6-diaminopimelate ligase [Desulfolutivibrio sulfoxidireducens]
MALAAVSSGAPLVAHSGKVAPGAVFVALTPDPALAAAHAAEAASRGAAFVVAAPGVALPEGSRARLIVAEHPRLALGELARTAHGTDRAGISLVGVTGTNGKTTTCFLLEHLLAASGRTVGLLGTVAYRWPGGSRPATLTTPGCLDLHGLFAEMAGAGVDTAVMEVSSHALDQDRVAGLSFAVAAYTNLTQDHLDYHHDMESYFAVKSRLFTDYLASPDHAVVNFDDPYGARLLAGLPGAVGYGLGQARPAGWRVLAGDIRRHDGAGLVLGASFEGQSWEIASPLIGRHNAQNLLAAMGVGLVLGLAPADMRALSGFGGVPGRLERVVNDRGLNVFVDYAHTPDALENVLRAVREVVSGRLFVVFGCGGDRDRTKRPLMAQAVAAYADVAVLTSDNPRHEDPLAIMADARPGLADQARVLEDSDRRRAIAKALDAMTPEDALVVAGKGHEAYQQIGDEKLPFHDATVIRELCACA